ncbi:transcriptional regulator [Micromonospora globispora]|uniref:Transcriptional regulator n=1 Tax=Micromonospora globispora TaxID=1450148 RepID=A0A317JTP8_9ACTN|nr:metalloregulator ArsR/SmtB family transcription factor [Micromonospora globispora]PWU43750.1 transcriptional regulator [Micromonospora globispora]PWU59279.1 transcriptional regulator [Micromonospora globispora]RQW92899.1 transcriptional regulator [Micromonospora globispora]
MTAQSDAAGEVLAALADPTRRLILDTLAKHGEATGTTLANELPVTRQAIVQHLSVLDRVGLVASRKDGRERWYAVRPRQLLDTARWMNQVAAQWNARLTTIKRLAEGVDGEFPGR